MRGFALVLLALALLPAAARADDVIDLQWSICDATPAAALQKLGLDPSAPGKKKQVTYYESRTAPYAPLGLSFRTKGKPDKLESSVKVRFPDRRSGLPPEADCSWDRYGAAETYTCEETNALDGSGASPWSAAQKGFVAGYQTVDWSALSAFGPYENPKWKLKVAGRKAVFDTVEAEGLHLMELSVKVPKSDDADVYRAVGGELGADGVVLCARQEGKTSRLLRALGLLQ
jgi:hypothetical protein